MPVALISTRTSPAFGPSRSSSTISSGFFASNATAARVFMVSSQGGSSLGDPVRRAGLNRQRRLGDRKFIGAADRRSPERPAARTAVADGRLGRIVYTHG